MLLAVSFNAGNALSTLLTVESFLFGALNVGVALSAGSALGRRMPISPAGLAAASTALVCVLAVGAGSAWWDIYSDWPDSLTGAIQAVCIAIGIVAQPCFSVAIALNVRS